MRAPFVRLRADRRGTAAAEFALVVPVLVLLLFGCFQFGVLFLANAGLQNAVGEGARMATLWPRRTPSQITAEINASRFGLNPDGLGTPELTYGSTGGQDFVDVRMTYTTELDLVFFKIDGIELEETRRAYMP
jgi:Flp pilus assembly pilin Flp